MIHKEAKYGLIWAIRNGYYLTVKSGITRSVFARDSYGTAQITKKNCTPNCMLLKLQYAPKKSKLKPFKAFKPLEEVKADEV
jgi:hypothetical protein